MSQGGAHGWMSQEDLRMPSSCGPLEHSMTLCSSLGLAGPQPSHL